MSYDIDRAAEMLHVAAKFIRKHAAEQTIVYDRAECDGYCLADDCEAAAEALYFEEDPR